MVDVGLAVEWKERFVANYIVTLGVLTLIDRETERCKSLTLHVVGAQLKEKCSSNFIEYASGCFADRVKWILGG